MHCTDCITNQVYRLKLCFAPLRTVTHKSAHTVVINQHQPIQGHIPNPMPFAGRVDGIEDVLVREEEEASKQQFLETLDRRVISSLQKKQFSKILKGDFGSITTPLARGQTVD